MRMRCWYYKLTHQALTCFERNDNQYDGTIWSCVAGPWHSLKKGRPKSKPDHVIRRASARYMESFNHQEALKMLLLSGKLWLIIFVAFLILLEAFKVRVILYIYMYIKPRLYGVKTYGIKGKDCKKLNKETYIFNDAMYVYKTTLRFSSTRKCKLIKLLTFIWVLKFIKVSGCYTKPTSATFFANVIMLFFNIRSKLLRADVN